MTTQNKNSETKRPAKTFRNRAISVNIWENDHQNPETGKLNTFYSLELRRGYKKGDDWKNTSSINGDDALRVANLFTRANNWILQQKYSLPAQSPQLAQEGGL